MFAKGRKNNTSFVDHYGERVDRRLLIGVTMHSIEHNHSSWVEAVEGERSDQYFLLMVIKLDDVKSY